MIVIDLGWQKYVMPKEQAMKLVEVLEKAEVYEAKYWNADKRRERGIDADYTYHVYPNDKQWTMSIITDDHYRLAKLAGKPEKD
jgi:hypothetical protein